MDLKLSEAFENKPSTESSQRANWRPLAKSIDEAPGLLPEMLFPQLITHGEEETTFDQRYYSSDQFYEKGGPAILYLGGESALSHKVMGTGEAHRLAKTLNASLFALEHRYYGKSQPFPDWTLPNLRYLSSGLALKDTARFIKSMGKPSQKWIVVGGSYAGSLAAWMRGEYPNLVHAAIASSAPVIATDDFSSYDTMVAKALGPTCSSSARRVSQIIDTAIDNGDRSVIDSIKDQFGCPDVADDIQFVSVLADSLATAVQYHRPGGKFNIDTVCRGIPSDDDNALLMHMANITRLYLATQNNTCSEATLVDELNETTISPKKATRQWTYQTCTEFGFWQFAPQVDSIRSQKMTQQWIYEMSCSPMFFGTLLGPPNTQISNFRHGSKLPASRIIYTNGGLDPWSQLSLLAPEPNSDTMHIMIEHASHTQDLSAATNSDHLDLKLAREMLASTLIQWLKPN
ncbi:Thymus-specific serine protease [Entomophthora muscae]|uniref:Thymus-specific serine protease n=1 Tax=Entomophthora muscae TaxID=34485 RepID=A0ACC2UG74_9FUNG|nr:Thymus-specific serine protease [Entomophthora muscae]